MTIKKNIDYRLVIRLCLIFLCGSILSSGLLFLFTRGTLISEYGSEGIVIKSTAAGIWLALILSNVIAFAVVVFLTVWTVRSTEQNDAASSVWYLKMNENPASSTENQPKIGVKDGRTGGRIGETTSVDS